jgi:hypothetical protein
VKAIAAIKQIFNNTGVAPLYSRKAISVHMANIWENGLQVDWLMDVMKTIGGVTHIIYVSRNPLRARISDILSTHGSADTSDQHDELSCASKYSSDNDKLTVSRDELFNMIVSQYNGFYDALYTSATKNIKNMGINYEQHIYSDINIGIDRVVNFIFDEVQSGSKSLNYGHSVAKPPHIVDYKPHFHCPLYSLLSNFDILKTSIQQYSLDWIIDSKEENAMTFEDVMISIQKFIENINTN